MKINSINRCNISGMKMNKSKLFYTLTISLLLISGALAKDQVNCGTTKRLKYSTTNNKVKSRRLEKIFS
jgi:hypothetical protein